MCNTTRRADASRFRTALGAAALALCGLFGAPALARQAGDALPPAPPDVMTAYRALDGWVRALQAPAEPAEIDPPGTTGVSITLRLSGAVLARATAMTEPDDAGETRPNALWQAAMGALAQARSRAPVERDALRDEALRDIARRITIDLQVAGPLTPLGGASADEAGLDVSAGLEGVALRAGARLRASFPGLMLSTNTTPAQAVIACCADLDLPRADLATLRLEHGLVLYRFPTTHLAQCAPGAEPVFLFRGQRIVRPSEITTVSLRAFADAVAAHLASRAWPAPRAGEKDAPSKGMLGDYEPWLDRYEPLVASPSQQGLSAYAMFRYATTPGVSPANAARAARFGWALLDQQENANDRDAAAPDDAPACALFILASLSAPPRPPGMPARMRPPLESALGARAQRAVLNAFVNEKWDDELPAPARALVAHACVAASLALPEDGELRRRAEGGVRSLFRDTSPGQLPSMMPWLGWAQLALSTGAATIGPAPALLDMRELLWKHQVSLADVGEDAPDLAGGVVFTASRSPLPTWQCARPLAFIATMLADPRLTPRDQAPGELARLSLSLRFLRQLEADEPLMHMFRDPERCLGGVREAPWNQVMTVESSAMTLLAVCEALRAADALSPAPVRRP